MSIIENVSITANVINEANLIYQRERSLRKASKELGFLSAEGEGIFNLHVQMY